MYASGVADRRRRAPRAAAPLTANDVVQAALALIDEVGVAGFTMRALAARLGTYPATLYWHVGNRNEILARVLQLVMGEMEVPPPASIAWDEWLAHVAREYRAALHRHPNTAVLALYPLDASPDFVEAMLAALSSGGFHGESLADAFNAIVGSVAGWVAVELSAAGGESDQQWQDDFERRVRGLSAEEHPTITSNIDYLADETFTLRWHGGAQRPLDRSFDAAVAVWIDGLRALRRRSQQ